MSSDLADRCEAASGADRAIDYDIAHLTGDHFRNDGKAPTYTASIDAALTLLKPNEFWRVGNDGDGPDPSSFRATISDTDGEWIDWHYGTAATPALALCAAALRAKENQNVG